MQKEAEESYEKMLKDFEEKKWNPSIDRNILLQFSQI